MPVLFSSGNTITVCSLAEQAAVAQQMQVQAYASASATGLLISNLTAAGTSTLANSTIASSTIASSTINGGTPLTTLYMPTLEIDEEDYVNHREYYELARARGIAWRIRTAEETRLAKERAEQVRIERERQEAARAVVRQRSRELLLAHLTKDQQRTFMDNKWFIVEGGKSKTQYKIKTDYGIAGNIDILAKGKKVASLCCHCRYDIPDADQFLAQKLALMYDEENFLKTANRRAA